MSAEKTPAGSAPMDRNTVHTDPRIEITPSASQYEQLCRDLAALRRAGAASNTVAVVEAVHAAAGDDLSPG